MVNGFESCYPDSHESLIFLGLWLFFYPHGNFHGKRSLWITNIFVKKFAIRFATVKWFKNYQQ